MANRVLNLQQLIAQRRRRRRRRQGVCLAIVAMLAIFLWPWQCQEADRPLVAGSAGTLANGHAVALRPAIAGIAKATRPSLQLAPSPDFSLRSEVFSLIQRRLPALEVCLAGDDLGQVTWRFTLNTASGRTSHHQYLTAAGARVALSAHQLACLAKELTEAPLALSATAGDKPQRVNLSLVLF